MSTIDEVSRAIGALQASVTHLSSLVATNNEVTEAVREDVAKLKTDVATIKADVGLMKPVVRKVEKFEQRVLGVSAFVAAVTSTAIPFALTWWKGKTGA